jgi:glutamine synthetase
VLNTAVADSLAQLADELERLTPGDFEGLTRILAGIARDNKQILFEGNGYSDEWHREAERRGLPNNRTTVDALPALGTDKAKDVFARFGVLSERELAARLDINWEHYVKVTNIEAACAVDIARTLILPAAVRFLGQLAGAPSAASSAVNELCGRIAGLTDELAAAIEALEHAQHEAHEADTVQAEARAFAGRVVPAQARLRAAAGELETLVADDLWPLPKYRELLFQY